MGQENKVTLELDRNDVGQILDGLYVRKQIWENTRGYMETGLADGEIEECSSAEEAGGVAEHYGRIIKEIERQMGAR